MHRLGVSTGGSREDLDPKQLETLLRAAEDGGVDSVWDGRVLRPRRHNGARAGRQVCNPPEHRSCIDVLDLPTRWHGPR